MEESDSREGLESPPQEEPENSSILLAKLEQENQALRDELANVIEMAAANERIWRHFAEIERILFRTRELDQFVEALLREVKHRFRPDQAIFLLCHPDLLEHFFPDRSETVAPVDKGAWVVPFPLEAGTSLCGESPKPFLLSPENIENLLHFLPDTIDRVQSGVLIPLCIHQIFFGALFLGSTDAERYRPEYGTDLLEHMGVKIALCLENCLTYERMKDFAIEDPLTGLPSFFQIHALLEREFRKARRLKAPLSVLVIDLSFFHEVDEHLDMGNEVLKHVADLLKEILPEGESVLGRYGSDEFLVLLPNVQEEEAREVGPYLSRKIRKSPFRYENTVILVQTVIGVGTLTDSMERSQDLLDAAYTELCRLKMLRYEPTA